MQYEYQDPEQLWVKARGNVGKSPHRCIAICFHLHPFNNPFPPKLVTLFPCGHIAAPFMQEEHQDPQQLWVKSLGNGGTHKES